MSVPQTDKDNRSFGLIMAGGLTALAVLRMAIAGALSWWLLGFGACFAAFALLCPGLLDPVRRLWMKLATVLGFINQRVLLTLLFGLLITPMAIALRLLGKRPIALGPDTAGSYWRSRKVEDFTASRMERQF